MKITLIALFLASPSFAAPKVVAPVPAPIMGTLLVTGQPGPSQGKVYSACSYKIDAQQRPVQGSIGKCNEFDLNVPKATPVGNYLLEYQNSMVAAVVNENQQASIKLVQLTLPAAPAATIFRAFVDYTDRNQQDLYALMRWIIPGNVTFTYPKVPGVGPLAEELDNLTCDIAASKDCLTRIFTLRDQCRVARSEIWKTACKGFFGRGYLDLIGTAILFDRDGGLSEAQPSFEFFYNKRPMQFSESTGDSKYTDPDRIYVNEKASPKWGSVAVFAGTYGVEFADDLGAGESRLGLIAN